MEIVHVIRQYSPSIGGLEDAVANLCQSLSRLSDIRVRVVTLNRIFTDPGKILPAREIINGIEVTRIPWIGSSRYPIAPGVLNAIKSADIVHVHAIDFFFDFLALTRSIHRKKLIAYTHGGFFHTPFAALLKKIYFLTITRLSCLAYDTICATSENDAATFARITPKNLITIESGVNVEKWADRGSKSAQRKIIFIGRWSGNKRVPLLIDLLANLRKIHPDWQLCIAGLPSGESAESLTAHAARNGIQDAVQLVVTPNQEQLSRLLSDVSYIASASDYEGFGLTIVEGLSAGLYPVVTPIPTFERLLKLLGFGVRIIVEDMPGTASALEQAHASLMKDTEKMRLQCMKLSQSYSWPRIAERFLQLYRKALV